MLGGEGRGSFDCKSTIAAVAHSPSVKRSHAIGRDAAKADVRPKKLLRVFARDQPAGSPVSGERLRILLLVETVLVSQEIRL
jgi:hypothetical protein